MKYSVIGLMSGTSMDGLDIAWCEFEYLNKTWHFKINNAVTKSYSEEWEEKLKNARNLSVKKLKELDVKYAELLALEVRSFIQKYNIKADFIASHGHTVHHRPEEGITIQIGDGATLSKSLGVDVVYDFRTQDVALLGQGAPLVPVGDQLLFSEYESCLNLGGFANISLTEKGERLAFDICPVNIVMNYYANALNLEYDSEGSIARSGQVNSELLMTLNNLEYYKADIPKSLGIEWVEKNIFPLINKEIEIKDVLRTVVEHIAFQIHSVLEKHGVESVLVTGGGAFNTFLLECLSNEPRYKIIVPISKVVDYKEAMIFGFLGVLRIRNEVNVLKSVTGAKHDHSSGKIARKQVCF